MDDRLHGEQGWRRGPSARQVLERHPRIRRDLELAKSLSLTLHQFDRLPEAERDYWIADHQIRSETCSECGNPVEQCSDPERVWYPYRRICYATMEREAAAHAYAALHGEDAGFHNGTFTDWAGARSESHPYSANDGVGIGISAHDYAPWDLFTTERDASPLRSVAEQSPDE